MIRRPPRSPLFPYAPLFRSYPRRETLPCHACQPASPPSSEPSPVFLQQRTWRHAELLLTGAILAPGRRTVTGLLRIAGLGRERDRKSTRLNSSHANISYAVF